MNCAACSRPMHFTDNRHYCLFCIQRTVNSPVGSEWDGWLAMGITSTLVKHVEALNAEQRIMGKAHRAIEKLAAARGIGVADQKPEDIAPSSAAAIEDAQSPTTGKDPHGVRSSILERVPHGSLR